jgi:aminoglycoside phosphotransferase (APT) family kinase protein
MAPGPGHEPDQPSPPRPGEGIDTASLSKWLSGTLPGFDPDIAVEQFPAGHSNLTYLVRSGSRELVVRRPPHGSRVKSAHDMGREYRVLSALHAVYEPAPRPFAYCEDPSVIGAPFYLMERKRGIVIRTELPPQLDGGEPSLRAISLAVIDNLARLHGIDWQSIGLSSFGKPDGYVLRQIDGWSRRWLDAQTEELPEMAVLASWLDQHQPPVSGAALIHNDYKLDNLMLDERDPSRVAAVLDWEMATVGDPLMDLGTTLSYWAEAGDPPEFRAVRMSPTTNPGFLTRRELVDRYAATSGRDPGDVLFYYVFGLFKLAVILQQIYRRYVMGLTQDHRFARLGGVVPELARQGVRALERAVF